MEKISLLISKKVISLDEGKYLGYVLDLAFDPSLKTFQGLLVVDDENEGVFFLPRKEIVSFSDECVMIEGEEVMQFDLFSSSNNPLGKEVFDEKGTNLGRVSEVEVTGRYVKKIITNKCEIPQKYIKKSGINYLIFGIYKNKKNSKIKSIFLHQEKIDNMKEKFPKVVASVSSEVIQEKNKIKRDENQMQIRLFASPNSLLGRKITKDLFGMNNEIIARKNEIISKKIINNAKNHNKLNFLAYFSQ